MDDVQQSIPQKNLGKAPAQEVFIGPAVARKKNLSASGKAARQREHAAEPQPAATENSAAAQVPFAGDAAFRRAVQEQEELCRFFQKRWAQYLSLPADISRCRSPVDLAQVQLSFLTRMAADYGTESSHFAQAFGDLVSEAMRLKPAPFFPKELPAN